LKRAVNRVGAGDVFFSPRLAGFVLYPPAISSRAGRPSGAWP